MTGHVQPAARSGQAGESTARVRVLLWHRAPAEGMEPVLEAYHTISRELIGFPGLINNEILRSPHDPERIVIASEWESFEAYLAWEKATGHSDTTAPLRPYRDHARTPPYEILEVVASY